jgi:hypothetical protein
VLLVLLFVGVFAALLFGSAKGASFVLHALHGRFSHPRALVNKDYGPMIDIIRAALRAAKAG